MDSDGWVLMSKKEVLFQELDKRKRRENPKTASQAQEVKGKARCHQSNKLLWCKREHDTYARSREQRLVARLLACQVDPMSGETDM